MRKGDHSGYNIVSILEGMQQDYWLGVSEKEETPQEVLECVIFSLGGELHACEMSYAVEVIRLPKLQKVPQTDSIIAGVFNLRGEITLAIDIRPLLSLPSPDLSKNSRILVLKAPTFKTGLITEAVHEVADLSYSTFSPLPEETLVAYGGFVQGQLCFNSRYVKLFDMAALLASPEIVVKQTFPGGNVLPALDGADS